MKKYFLLILFFAAFSAITFSQVVSVQMEKTLLLRGDEIEFAVHCASEQDLEITVFTEGHLVSNQKATLTPGDNAFHFATSDCPDGKYFVLVTGNAIHVEKEFYIRAKK